MRERARERETERERESERERERERESMDQWYIKYGDPAWKAQVEQCERELWPNIARENYAQTLRQRNMARQCLQFYVLMTHD